MARDRNDFIAFQNERLRQKGDGVMMGVEKSQIFRPLPGPENSGRKVFFVEAVARLLCQMAARRDYQRQSQIGCSAFLFSIHRGISSGYLKDAEDSAPKARACSAWKPQPRARKTTGSFWSAGDGVDASRPSAWQERRTRRISRCIYGAACCRAW